MSTREFHNNFLDTERGEKFKILQYSQEIATCFRDRPKRFSMQKKTFLFLWGFFNVITDEAVWLIHEMK